MDLPWIDAWRDTGHVFCMSLGGSYIPGLPWRMSAPKVNRRCLKKNLRVKDGSERRKASALESGVATFAWVGQSGPCKWLGQAASGQTSYTVAARRSGISHNRKLNNIPPYLSLLQPSFPLLHDKSRSRRHPVGKVANKGEAHSLPLRASLIWI
jgi:hypothetical protein